MLVLYSSSFDKTIVTAWPMSRPSSPGVDYVRTASPYEAWRGSISLKGTETSPAYDCNTAELAHRDQKTAITQSAWWADMESEVTARMIHLDVPQWAFGINIRSRLTSLKRLTSSRISRAIISF